MKSTSPKLHIRTTISGKWIWELRTPDKHTVNVSDGFDTRAACEADAKANGFEVVPKRSRKGQEQIALKVVPVSAEPGAWLIHEDDSGLWHWTRAGEEEDASRCAFLTRRECVADACRHGYRVERSDDVETE